MSFDKSLHQLMINTALLSIDHGLKEKKMLQINLETYPSTLSKLGASFVTLQLKKQLRGCIGSLDARHPLIFDIASNAHRAAFHDPRFLPLTEQEFLDIKIEISILSEPKPLPVKNEAELIAQLKPYIDGLILIEQGQKSTFLPSVWDQIATPKEFISYLKNKAGLPSDYWSPSICFFRYTTEKIQ